MENSQNLHSQPSSPPHAYPPPSCDPPVWKLGRHPPFGDEHVTLDVTECGVPPGEEELHRRLKAREVRLLSVRRAC